MKRVLASIAVAAVLGSALIATAPTAAAADDAALYIAPGGDDTASGAIDAPLATLEGARDRIRQLKQDSGMPDGGLTVYLRDGSTCAMRPSRSAPQTPAPRTLRSPIAPTPVRRPLSPG